MNGKKKLYWTQTPEGKKKLSQQSQNMWRIRNKDVRNEVESKIASENASRTKIDLIDRILSCDDATIERLHRILDAGVPANAIQASDKTIGKDFKKAA